MKGEKGRIGEPAPVLDFTTEPFDPTNDKHVEILLSQSPEMLKATFRQYIHTVMLSLVEDRALGGFGQLLICVHILGKDKSDSKILSSLKLVTQLASELADELYKKRADEGLLVPGERRLQVAMVHSGRTSANDDANPAKYRGSTNEELIGEMQEGLIDIMVANKMVDTGFDCPLLSVSAKPEGYRAYVV